MNDEETLPPHQPNTPLVLLKRFWALAARKVAAYPDRALVVFLVLLGIAVIH